MHQLAAAYVLVLFWRCQAAQEVLAEKWTQHDEHLRQLGYKDIVKALQHVKPSTSRADAYVQGTHGQRYNHGDGSFSSPGRKINPDLSDLMMAMATEAGTLGGTGRGRWQGSKEEESSTDGAEQPTGSSSKSSSRGVRGVTSQGIEGEVGVNGTDGAKKDGSEGREEEVFAALGRMVWQYMNQVG